METPKPKTLGDLPKFVVTAVRRGASSNDGYSRFEIEGRFDPILEGTFEQIIGGTVAQWFWLLFDDRGCICPMLKSFDKQTRTAILAFDEREEPKLLGLELAYLSSYWQSFHVWMVLDPGWGWERTQFQPTDAVAEDYEAEDISIVEGREVKVWTKLEPVSTSPGQSHYRPAGQALTLRSGTRLIPGGWDHEHCELCNCHIDAGMFGFCDPGNRWMCEKCFERYVVRHDLAFVDSL